MEFKILHLSSGRARIRANFRLTPDVKVYFKEQASKIENIQKVNFYQDEYTFVVIFKEGHGSCLQEFFKLIDKEKVKKEQEKIEQLQDIDNTTADYMATTVRNINNNKKEVIDFSDEE